jgi:segregation and condensation protein B
MAKNRTTDAASPQAAAQAVAGFTSPPQDDGLSIDRLAQAFAAMMGAPDPYAAAPAAEMVRVDPSPDLDDAREDDDAVPVTPAAILEAALFVGLPGGRPISSRALAALMRGVRPAEIDELAVELQDRYAADGCPYEVVSREDGWLLQLRPEFARFGSVLEGRARLVRLDADALDVLALVAWNQPVPRDRLVELGCDARPAVLRQLVQRGLLELRPAVGDAPPTYHTTPRFLEMFRLTSLTDLPDPSAPPP